MYLDQVYCENINCFRLEYGVSSWLRHCATRMEFASSIPGGVLEISKWPHLSVRTQYACGPPILSNK